MEMNPAALEALLNDDKDNFFVASIPRGIEAQEKAGQDMFVSNEILPKEMIGGCTREKLESIGIKFKDDYDDIFINVELPAGWKKEATDHSMWSKLVDEKGHERAAIFYKAAFYDRHAHINLTSRFRATYTSEDDYKTEMSYKERERGNWCGVVYDCDKIIFKTDLVKAQNYFDRQKLADKALQWLKEKYPDYQNPLAYWD